MLRDPRPYKKGKRGLHYIDLPMPDGKRKTFPLGPAEGLPERYAELKARYHSGQLFPAPGKEDKDPLVKLLFEKFLEAVRQDTEKEPGTYEFYWLGSVAWAKFIAARNLVQLTISQLSHQTLRDWLAFFKEKWKSANTRRARLRAIQKVTSWALENKLIDQDPIADFRKPVYTPRQETVSRERVQKFKSKILLPCHLDVVITYEELGCRPMELYRVCAEHVDLEKGTWTLPRLLSKGKYKSRRILLTPNVLEITRRLMKEHPEGPLFRNAWDLPWTNKSLCKLFHRIMQRGGGNLKATALRHTVTTELIEQRTPTSMVGKIMGHEDTTMVSRVYDHCERNDQILRDELIRRLPEELDTSSEAHPSPDSSLAIPAACGDGLGI